MQSSIPFLSLAIWVPIAFGALVLATGNDGRASWVRGLSLLGALISLLVTLPLVSGFDAAAHGMQFVEKSLWIERFNVYYHLGIDGLSLWFIPLTAFITVLVVIAGFEVARLPGWLQLGAPARIN